VTDVGQVSEPAGYRRHGNVFRALQTVSWLNLDIDAQDPTEKQQKLLKKIDEFETYIRNNAMLIPNYGEQWRNGETITPAFVKSTINQVVSKRMVKKQQMRWSQQGAHLLLHIRTRVLNDELREIFDRWYPIISLAGEHPDHIFPQLKSSGIIHALFRPLKIDQLKDAMEHVLDSV